MTARRKTKEAILLIVERIKPGMLRVSIQPSQNLWILEIQIRRPTIPIGGFFEDLLVTETQ